MAATRQYEETNSIVREALRYGPVMTFLVMFVIAFGVAYLVYSYVIYDWSKSVNEYRTAVAKKELENERTEALLADEEQFRARMDKIVGLYNDAKPLLPQETEVSDVLGQVEIAAKRNGVTVTGLQAVKESVKSPTAAKLYEREIPALVTGTYPQVVNFLTDVSRMPRILVVRDYSIVSQKSTVTAGFTLIAYHSPPPAEMPVIPAATARVDPLNGGAK